MIKKISLVLILFIQFSIKAQVNQAEVNQSPYHVIYNHLYYLQEDSYEPQKAARSFDINDTKESKKTAIKLKQILDGRGAFINVDALPKTNNYVDSVSGLSIYKLDLILPDVYLEKKGDKWYYSDHTVKEIPHLFNQIYPFGENLEVYFSAPIWKDKFLGVKYWQWLCLLGLVIVFFIFVLLVHGFITLLIAIFSKSKRLKRFFDKNDNVNKVKRILALWLATVFIKQLVPALQLSPFSNSIIIKGLEILGIFFVILLVLKLVASLFDYFGKLAEKTDNTMDDQLLPVTRKIINVIVWLVGLIYVLSHLNVNVTAILAGLSIGGLALALAAQDTVKNFFGSVMIFLDRPFQIGDWIHFDDVDGIVEEVGIRSTRIRTFSNSLVYVPNAHLADATIDNLGLRKFRRYKTELGVTYDTPPEIIDVFVEGIKQIIENHPTTRKDYFEVSLNSFGASSINILLYMFFEADNYTKELKGKHEIIYGIIQLANNIGVRFAFPTQTLHIEEFPEKKLGTPDAPTRENAKAKSEETLAQLKHYFNASLDKGNKGEHNPLGGE